MAFVVKTFCALLLFNYVAANPSPEDLSRYNGDLETSNGYNQPGLFNQIQYPNIALPQINAEARPNLNYENVAQQHPSYNGWVNQPQIPIQQHQFVQNHLQSPQILPIQEELQRQQLAALSRRRPLHEQIQQHENIGQLQIQEQSQQQSISEQLQQRQQIDALKDRISQLPLREHILQQSVPSLTERELLQEQVQQQHAAMQEQLQRFSIENAQPIRVTETPYESSVSVQSRPFVNKAVAESLRPSFPSLSNIFKNIKYPVRQQHLVQVLNEPAESIQKHNYQNILSNPKNQEIVRGSENPKRYVVIFPNGTVANVDEIDHIIRKNPNYVMVNKEEHVSNEYVVEAQDESKQQTLRVVPTVSAQNTAQPLPAPVNAKGSVGQPPTVAKVDIGLNGNPVISASYLSPPSSDPINPTPVPSPVVDKQPAPSVNKNLSSSHIQTTTPVPIKVELVGAVLADGKPQKNTNVDIGLDEKPISVEANASSPNLNEDNPVSSTPVPTLKPTASNPEEPLIAEYITAVSENGKPPIISDITIGPDGKLTYSKSTPEPSDDDDFSTKKLSEPPESSGDYVTLASPDGKNSLNVKIDVNGQPIIKNITSARNDNPKDKQAPTLESSRPQSLKTIPEVQYFSIVSFPDKEHSISKLPIDSDGKPLIQSPTPSDSSSGENDQDKPIVQYFSVYSSPGIPLQINKVEIGPDGRLIPSSNNSTGSLTEKPKSPDSCSDESEPELPLTKPKRKSSLKNNTNKITIHQKRKQQSKAKEAKDKSKSVGDMNKSSYRNQKSNKKENLSGCQESQAASDENKSENNRDTSASNESQSASKENKSANNENQSFSNESKSVSVENQSSSYDSQSVSKENLSNSDDNKLDSNEESDSEEINTLKPNLPSQPNVWFRTTDIDFWKKITSGDEKFDILYFFQVPPAQPLVEKETRRTIHPNGTIVEEVIDIVRDSESDSEPTVTKTTTIFHDNDIVKQITMGNNHQNS